MLTTDVDEADIHVLLVEDDDDDAYLVQRALKRLPQLIHLSRARNGAEALAHFRPPAAADGKRAELVILDINMPVMTGDEFLAVFRGEHVADKVPVIVLTTIKEPQFLESMRAKGANLALSKDIHDDDVADLRQAIMDLWFHGSIDMTAPATIDLDTVVG